MKLCVLIVALLTASMHGQDVDHPLKIGGDVSAPILIHQDDLQIPASVMKKLHDIHIVASLIVNQDGMPDRVVVRESNLPDAWKNKARENLEAYRFRPAMRSGTPVAVTLNLETYIDGF